jgi:G3E family GTPase
MRLLIFSGFLGSGKTTLVLALARRLAAHGSTSAIIVNEIGEVGIDGKVLGDSGLAVYEITAGCICCQIGVDLVRTLQEIGERYHPDVVIVEGSGVATPAGIRDALTYYRGEPFAAITVVTVVDPTRFEALIDVLTPLIEAQIMGADELVITKIDQATSTEVDDARAGVERLRPGASVSLVAAPDERSLGPLLVRLMTGGEREVAP